MNFTYCDYMVWKGLPVLRKAIADSLVNDFGLSQKETAKILGISPAAVSQYLSGKRGNMNVNDKDIFKEINKSAERIIQQGDEILDYELCRLCKICSSKKMFSLREIGGNCEIL